MDFLISVVVPIYNVEMYLERCLESIVNQTYKNLEIILVDDSSPDKCPQICDEWAKRDNRIKVIHKENQGAGMARNTGIENATGDYICFFDSDDYVSPELIEKCINTIKKTNSEVVLYAHSDFDSEGNEFLCGKSILEAKTYDSVLIKEKLLPELISHDYRKGPMHNYALSVWSSMFSLSVIKEKNIRFLSEREINSEDAFFLIELYSKLTTVTVIPDILYYHFINTGSISFSYTAEHQKVNNTFLKETLALAERVGHLPIVKDRIVSLYHIFTIATLKLTFSNDKKENVKIIKNMLDEKQMRNTLSLKILLTEKKKIGLLFLFAKLRMYSLCYLMLKIKMSL